MIRFWSILFIVLLALACGQNNSSSYQTSDLITVREFSDYLTKSGKTHTADSIGWAGYYDPQYKRWRRMLQANYLKPDGKKAALATEPVTLLSWTEAQNYCKAKGGRLPTLDEIKSMHTDLHKTELYGEWTSTQYSGGKSEPHFESAMLINGISLPGYYVYTYNKNIAELEIPDQKIPAEERYGLSKISCRCVYP